MGSLSNERTIYQEKVKLNVSRLTFARNPERSCGDAATQVGASCRGWIHQRDPADRDERGDATRSRGVREGRGTRDTLTGNPAVIGPDLTRRPEALRPHLSMGLPKQAPVLCTGAPDRASNDIERCEP